MTAMAMTATASGLRRSVPWDSRPIRPRANYQLWRRCWQGLEPAESLPTRDREDLIWDMVDGLGWTDQEIADHTRMTLYTIVRIRDRLGLQANRDWNAEAG